MKNVSLPDNVAKALSYIEFKGKIAQYCKAHEYTVSQGMDNYYDCKVIYNRFKVLGFTDIDLNNLFLTF